MAETAVFTVTASENPGRVMDVRYTPSESGSDFLAAATEVTTTTPSPLDFNNADLTDTISIPIQDDSNIENTAMITVTPRRTRSWCKKGIYIR